MAKTEDATPVRRQYLEIKRRYPNAILFFRLGDFYETFDEDAHIASRELDIVLTSRNVSKGQRVPMAGIPFHAAEAYLARLIAKGYHVAICEQIGETPSKGLFPRQVVRVVTPGTVVEDGLLPSEANNYLAAVMIKDGSAGIAYADVSTGEFAAAEVADGGMAESAARHELIRIQPAEILVPDEQPIAEGISGHPTRLPAWRFEMERATQILKQHLGVATLEGFGLKGKPLAICAAGALVDYLAENQPNALKLLIDLTVYGLDDFMVLDGATRRNLELAENLRDGTAPGSLLGCLDRTRTAMGRRLLRQRIGKPLLSISGINERLDEVEALIDNGLLRAEVRQTLGEIGDLERLTNRTVAGLATPRDLASLRQLLKLLEKLQQQFEGDLPGPIKRLAGEIDPCLAARRLLEQALADDVPATLAGAGVIRPGFDERLDDLVRGSQQARNWIANLEQSERSQTGIKSLKVGYNKVFGYYLEVTKANAHLVPESYIRKQTLVSAERYITPEMKEYESRVLSAEERIRELEAEIFHALCQEISGYAAGLMQTARAIARLDVAAGLADVAQAKGYCRPEVVEGTGMEIRDGRHPVVEQYLEGKRFVPNDTVFEQGECIRVITGPNMSGKSTYLRQVALMALMAQMGSYIPARSARLGLVDRIFTRIGAQDEIHAGQSTFMVEMIEAANILHSATPRSLLVLDEIGRGTSTYDGLSIAWAVIEYLHSHPRLRSRTLFATHYHELTKLADLLPGVRNYNVAVAEQGGQVIFMHKIVPGGADRSYGIHVAQLAGLPQPVINRAQEILAQLEAEGASTPGSQRLPSPRQLSFFSSDDGWIEELKSLDVASLTPLEALNKLYEWQQRMAAGQNRPAGNNQSD
jgi:DNA mismatch repair protein MutS